MQLWQPEHSGGEQFRLIMGEAVPRRVQRCVLQTERSRQVDQAADLAMELRRQRHRCLMWQPEEHHIEPLGLRWVELVEHEVGIAGSETGVQGAGQRAGLAVASGVHDLELWMLGAQPQQLCSGVPRCADDSDSFHGV